MKVEQIYTGCLAQGAYYIESEGEAVIIDPLREVAPYVQKAAKNGVKIKYILETHFHADFVSGHITLAQKTGAPIVYGPNAATKFEAHIAKDGEEFKVGKVSIKVLHTPGHTLESTTYLLKDENGKDHAIFTGDTLFLGDVGRPDLAQKMDGITQDDLAGMLYDSLRTKIMPLADEVIVYPAHGAGSACGKNMMKETVDTLGNQKQMNYALRANMTKAEFIKEVTDGLLPPPTYFPANVKLNQEGYQSIDTVLATGAKPLNAEAFELVANRAEALILDTRQPQEFAKGHIPNAIFIGLNGSFAPWVGALIADIATPILLITAPNKAEEAVTRLARVGFDNTIGFLEGGMEAWKNAGNEIDTVTSIAATEFAQRLSKETLPVFDVRKPNEFASMHMEGANSTPLSSINDFLSEFSQVNTAYVHCAGGYRSMIAASILKSRGIHHLVDVQGGFNAIKATNTIPLTDFVCPSTL